MLIGTIYLKQTHLVLRDVDGSEVGLTLDDALKVCTYVKDHRQEIEARRQTNWQEYITSIVRGEQEQEGK
jgi:hypothetical protein